jgi:hypothetical protein
VGATRERRGTLDGCHPECCVTVERCRTRLDKPSGSRYSEDEHLMFPSSPSVCVVVCACVFRECSVQPNAPLAPSSRVSCREPRARWWPHPLKPSAQPPAPPSLCWSWRERSTEPPLGMSRMRPYPLAPPVQLAPQPDTFMEKGTHEDGLDSL